MYLTNLPHELIHSIVDHLSPPLAEWDEVCDWGFHRAPTKWFLDLRLVCRCFDSTVITCIFSAIKANPSFDELPLVRGIPTPSMAAMCARLIMEQVQRDPGGSNYSLVRTIVDGADAAVELLQGHHPDTKELRKCYLRGLLSTIVGLMRTYTPLAHLADKEEDDNPNENFEFSDRASVVLVVAAHLGRLSDMDYLLNLEADANFDRETGWLGSPYHAAAVRGHIGALQLLMNRGVDINARGCGNGDTALHFAAAAGKDDAVRFLLAWGADADARNEQQETPLLCATAAGYSETTRLLLGCGVDVNAQDMTGKTPLLWAAWRGHVEVMKALLAQDEIDVECKDTEEAGITPLAAAALSGRKEAVNLLLEQPNINVHATDDLQHTILKHAVAGGNEAVVKTILSLPGIDVNSVGDEGTTPLMWAARNGNEPVVRLLLAQEGIEVNLRADQGLTALTLAITSEHLGVITALLERGDVDINFSHDDSEELQGMTLLGLLAAAGNEKMVRLLLDQPDIRPDFIDMSDRTPLAVAAIHDHPAVIKLLIAREDVDVNAADSDGYTALMHAAEQGSEAAAGALLEAPDIQVWLTNHSEETALVLAVTEDNTDMARALLEPNRGFTLKHIQDALKLATRTGQKALQEYLRSQAKLLKNGNS